MFYNKKYIYILHFSCEFGNRYYYEPDWFNSASLAKNAAMNAALRQAFENLTASATQHLHYVYGQQILAGQEGEGAFVNPTVGGTHPSDLGQYDMADFYSTYLPTVIDGS